MSCNNAFLNSKYISSFSPANLAGLTLWLDAADSRTVTRTGSTVTQWLDKSPNAYAGTFTAGRNFTYELAVQNGLNCVRTATGQTMIITNFVLGPFMSIFKVYYPINTAAGSPFIEHSQDTNSFSGFYFHAQTNGQFGIRNTSGFSFISVPTTAISNTWQLIQGINQDVTSSSNMTLYVNGTFSSGLPSITGTNVTSNLYINGRDNTNTLSYPAYLAEIIIYNRGLSGDDRRRVEGYLMRKWNLLNLLPNANVYKTLPPFLRPFNPLDICGLSVWIDAADRRKIDVSATLNRVTSISNKAVPTQDFSINPTGIVNYITYTSIDNRGYPALTLPGGQRYITNRTDLSRAVFFSDSCTCTVFAAWDICGTTTGTNAAAFGAFGVVSTTTIRAAVFFTGSTGTGFWQAGTSTGATVNMPAQALGTPRVQVFRRNGLQMIYRNFGTQTTSNNATSAPQIQSNTLYRFDITAQANVGGKIYEILWYNRSLADTEVNSVEVYLAEKWGLRSSLTTNVPPRFTRALTPVFNPVVISNCVLWLDAADLARITLSGSSVTTWGDKSGNGTNATTLSSNPTYSSDSVVYNGAQGLATTLPSSNAESGFIVASFTNVANANSMLCGPTFGGRQFRVQGGTIQTVRQGVVNVLTSGSALANNTQYLLEYTNNATTLTHFLNGSTYASGAAQAYNTAVTTNIGGPAESMVGSLREVVIFNRAVTLQERQQIEAYLAWKWGLVGSLPSTHPYKTIPV